MFKIVSLFLCFSFFAVNQGVASGRDEEPDERLKAFRAKLAEKEKRKYSKPAKAPSSKQMQKNNKGLPQGRK